MYLITKCGLLIGRCVGDDEKGWRFLPQTTSHKPSRRAWPTANECIPGWAFTMADDFLTAKEWEDRKSSGSGERAT